jgi:hypothetical protein
MLRSRRRKRSLLKILQIQPASSPRTHLLEKRRRSKERRLIRRRRKISKQAKKAQESLLNR